MSVKKLLYTFITGLFLMVNPAYAATKTVCASGCDYATITLAEASAAAGDTINISAGDYPESVTVDVSGTAGNVITFACPTGTCTVRQFTINADYITLSGLYIGYSGNPAGSSNVMISQGSDNVTLTGCTIDAGSASGHIGISMYGSNGLVTGTTIKNIYCSTAVNVGYPGAGTPSSSNTVTLSKIESTIDTDAFRFWGDNHTISFNEVTGNVLGDCAKDNHSDFIQTFTDDAPCDEQTWDSSTLLVDGNYVHDTECQLYFFSNVCSATMNAWTFRNNVFYNILNMGQAPNYTGAITNLKFYNNVFHKVGYNTGVGYTHAFTVTQAGSSGEIKNNIFLENSDDPTSLTQGWFSYAGTFTHSNNYVGGSSYAAKTITEDGIVNGGDPKFVSEATQDYRLTGDSPIGLRTGGVAIDGFTADKNGVSWANPPSIGAYQYEASPTVWGVTPSTSGTGCTISPEIVTYVDNNATQAFTIAISSGYHLTSVSGTCGGSGTTTFTTSAVTADCTVVANCRSDKGSATIVAPGTSGAGTATIVAPGTSGAGTITF